MTPVVGIIMGSDSDLQVMLEAAKVLGVSLSVKCLWREREKELPRFNMHTTPARGVGKV